MKMVRQSVPLSRLLGGGTAGQSGSSHTLSATSSGTEERNRRGHFGCRSFCPFVRLLVGSKPCFRFTQTACPAGLKAAHEVRHEAA